MSDPLNVLLLEPFYTGSHKHWANGLQKHSRHHIQLLTLPGRHWKWRMHGGAISLAQQFLKSNWQPDVLLASDMLNLPVFLSLCRHRLSGIPIGLYFHENQLNYPWSDQDRDIEKQRDHHYTFINYTSSLVADELAFNSQFHQDEFLGELPKFLKAFPDRREIQLARDLKAKSRVLPIALELHRFDRFKAQAQRSGPPVILWNHRWEYDKNPGDFLDALKAVESAKLDFQLILLGERYEQYPTEFDEIQTRYADKILSATYAKNFSEYAHWVCQADILPVTSIHDFFGISVVEAMYCNVYPLLPNRLAYPEHLPPLAEKKHLYKSKTDLHKKLIQAIRQIDQLRKIRTDLYVHHYSWKHQISGYDDWLANLTTTSS